MPFWWFLRTLLRKCDRDSAIISDVLPEMDHARQQLKNLETTEFLTDDLKKIENVFGERA